jgi:hypothetical protein
MRTLFLLLAVAVLWIPSPHAQAGMRICASNTTSPQDLRNLKSAARSALPADVSLPEAPSICRNPGHASAWLETGHQQNPEGAEEWWILNCDRDEGRWSCESPVLKRKIALALPFAGQQRHITIFFDAKTATALAQELATRALYIFDDASTSIQPCGAPAASGDVREDWSAALKRVRPSSAETDLSVEVRTNADGAEVVLFDGTLGILFREDGSECWNEWVIVT